MAAIRLCMFTLVIGDGFSFLRGSSVAFGHWNAGAVDELLVSKEDLESYTKNSTAKWPLCILYRDPHTHSSALEEGFMTFLRGLPGNTFLKNWTIVAFNLDRGMLFWEGHPGTVPILQCHIWTADSPISYLWSNQKHVTASSFLWWFKNVKKMFASRVSPVTSDCLSDVINSHGGYTLVGIPGHLHHQTMEKNLIKMAKSWKKRIKVFVVIPLLGGEMFMKQTFNISQLPAVIAFSSQDWKETKRPVLLLQGVREVEERSLEVSLVTLHSQAIHLNLDNFLNEAMETKHPQPPIVVCFYSPRSSHTLSYLNGFHRSYDTFSKMRLSLRFGILNIVEYPQVISRHINASDVNAVPFTVAFWQEREMTTQKFIVKQQVFGKGVPTPLVLYEFLKVLSVSLISGAPSSDNSEIYNPWEESSDSKRSTLYGKIGFFLQGDV